MGNSKDLFAELSTKFNSLKIHFENIEDDIEIEPVARNESPKKFSVGNNKGRNKKIYISLLGLRLYLEIDELKTIKKNIDYFLRKEKLLK